LKAAILKALDLESSEGYLWEGALTYLILMVLWTGSSFALKAVGFEELRSLQPMLNNPIISLVYSLLGLEEVFYNTSLRN